MRWLPIGHIAREAGISVATIRYYERQGLVEEAIRGANGFRLFKHEAIARLQQIKQSKTRGLSLAQIRDLLVEELT